MKHELRISVAPSTGRGIATSTQATTGKSDRTTRMPAIHTPMIRAATPVALAMPTLAEKVFPPSPPISAENMLWLRLVVGFDIIFTALAMALVDTVLVG